MTGFTTHCCKSAASTAVRRYCGRWLSVLFVAFVVALTPAFAQPTAPTAAADITSFKLEREADQVLLSATIAFELPSAVREVLSKGVPLVFAAQAQIYRPRWYWTDKRVSAAQRQMRLSYQPLTRRWRVQTSAGAAGQGLGGALAQSYDSLDDALAAIKRIARWRIAEGLELEPSAKHNLDFRFALDLSQLPRPLQLGLITRADWDIAVSTVRTLPGDAEK